MTSSFPRFGRFFNPPVEVDEARCLLPLGGVDGGISASGALSELVVVLAPTGSAIGIVVVDCVESNGI